MLARSRDRIGKERGIRRRQLKRLWQRLAYCLHVTLQRRLRDLAPGLTPRPELEKFGAMQMIDVHLPTTDGREVILTRYTQPERDQELLLRELKLQLPEQPPPKIRALQAKAA